MAEPTNTEVARAPGLSLSRFASSDFAGSGNCAECHSALTDQAGNDVSIDAHWRSAMMANSARDPLWQAKVSSEVARNPALREVIEDKCATCHMPMARTQVVTDSSPVAVLDDGFLDRDHPLNDAAMDGVSCTVCHQIQDRDLGKPAGFSGHYGIDTSTVEPDRLIFGPFADPVQQMMRTMVGFTPVQGRHVSGSALCATCHTLFTPYVDGQGSVLGEFPEQVPYLEWEHSAYGDGVGQDQTCQHCHMPAAEAAVVISNRPMGRMLTARSPFGQHHFVGGNAFMLSLLQTRVGELGLTASTAHLEATLARTLSQLQTRTAGLAVVESGVTDGVLTTVVEVENRTGHKLPSGFPSRRAWLHVTVVDADEQTIFESGQPQTDGSIAGNDADQDPTAFERHHSVISAPDEVQIYEPIMQDSDGQVTYTLLRGASYAKDNRLLPDGFSKEDASQSIAVQGVAISDEDFVGGTDQVTYQVNVEGHPGPFTLYAELLYQTVSYRFVLDLSQDRTSSVEQFIGYYDQSPREPTVLAAAQETVG